MKERPILVAVIGYIIGILWGLYFKISIVFCYILILAIIYYIQKNFFFKRQKKRNFKLISFHRYSRYLKLIIDKKVILILIILSSISNTVVLYQNNQYENFYKNSEKIQVIGIITSQKIEKQYYDLYQIKLVQEGNFNLYIQVSKENQRLKYGDKVKVQGEYNKPSKQRNYGGYNDEQYLKTLKIVGRVKAEKVEIVENKKFNLLLQIANSVKEKIEKKIESNFEKEKSSILKGLLLGDTTEIEDKVKENFQIANISHILAISGMHITYIIMGVQLGAKRILGKTKTKYLTILILIFYIFITGFSPSIIRAVVMGIITIGEEIVHRKSDTWNSIAISLLIVLIYNPFSVFSVGLQLSYLGTVGIILFSSTILSILNKFKLKKESIMKNKIKQMIAVTLSAQIMILPIMLYHFNIIGIYFLITNLLVSIIIGLIVILGFLSIFIKIFAIPLNIGIEFLMLITKFSNLPFAKIYIITPSIVGIIGYFITLQILEQIYFIYQLKVLRSTHKRVKNLIALIYYRFLQKKKKYLRIIIGIILIMIIISYFPKSMKLHFVDVGQGDCTFIVTPRNKTILIDGGGSLSKDYNIGKKTLIPYLLDRGYTTIDYVMISHFDQDHVRLYPIFVTRDKSEKCNYRETI